MIDPQWLVAEKRPATKLPRNVPPRTDRKYPTFRLMTANILDYGQQCQGQGQADSKTYNKYPTPAMTTSKHARGRSCVILQGRTPANLPFELVVFFSSLSLLETLTTDPVVPNLPSFSFSSTPAMMYRRLDSISCHLRSWTARSANKALKMVARPMRKIQVPAYWPEVEGVQLLE